MASAWLLATFAGMGFAISQTIHVAVAPEVLVAMLAIAGAIGITLLWILDLLVYHRLLDSCFIEGLILEEQYPWLPPIRSNMMKTQEGRGVLFHTVGFYMAPVVLLIVVAGAGFAVWFYGAHHFVASAVAAVAGLGFAFLAAKVIQAKTGNTAALKKRLESARRMKDSSKA
jgi:hypothetical protein